MTRGFPLSLRFILVFTMLGFLLSAYSSIVETFSGQCINMKTCVLFLGLPTGLYVTLLLAIPAVFAFLVHEHRMPLVLALALIAAITFLGTAICTVVIALEFTTFGRVGFAGYPVGVPTSFIGLVAFLLIFMTAALAWSYQRERDR